MAFFRAAIGGGGGSSGDMAVHYVNSRAEAGHARTESITITKAVSKFVILVNLWNGASGSYASNYKIKINGTEYTAWKNNMTPIGRTSNGTLTGAYGCWYSLEVKTLNVGDVVELDLSASQANANYGLGIVLLE